MGQAKRRGTFEERRQQAINKRLEEQLKQNPEKPIHTQSIGRAVRRHPFAVSVAAMAMLSAGFNFK